METEQMKPLADFIHEHRITCTTQRANDNPNMDDTPWKKTARRWLVTLMRQPSPDFPGRVVFSVPFSQGSAYKTPPTAADVLNSLASDALTVENARNFEEWAAEYGYDTDSRKAEASYVVTRRQTRLLEKFLTRQLFDELLYKVERL